MTTSATAKTGTSAKKATVASPTVQTSCGPNTFPVTATIALGTADRLAPNDTIVQFLQLNSTTGEEYGGETNSSGVVQADPSSPLTPLCMPDGTYRSQLLIAPAGYVQGFYQNNDCAGGCDLVVADAPVAVTIVIPYGNTISGTVTNDSGTPLDGVKVYTDWFDPTSHKYNEARGSEVKTNSKGEYSFPSLSDGVYEIDFEGSDTYAVQSWPDTSIYYEPDLITAIAGSNGGFVQTGVDAQLHKAATIYGAVTQSGGSDAITDAQNYELGVEVEVYDSELGWVETGDYYAVTATNGKLNYEVYGLAPDEYELRLVDLAQPTLAQPVTSVINVTAGQTVSKTLTLPVEPDRLVTGQLVRASASSPVYLYDDPGKLIPVPSLDAVTALGLSTTVHTVTPVTLTTVPTVAGSLGAVVSCEGTSYLAASQKIWTVAASTIATQTPTSLSTGICSDLVRGAVPLNAGFLAEAVGTSTVWFVDVNGVRHGVPLASEDAALAIPGAPTILSVAAGFIDSLPTGAEILVPGILVTPASSSTDYLFDGTSFLPLEYSGVAADMGLAAQPLTVSAGTITTVGETLTNAIDCGGQDYLAGSGRLWPIPLRTVHIPGAPLAPKLCAALGAMAGTPLRAVVVQSESTGDYWTLANGAKTIAAGPGQQTVIDVNQQFLDAVPTAVNH